MRRYLIFVTTSLSLLMYAIDATIVAVAFPNFTRELHSNVLWSAWTISIFFIAVTMTVPLAGNLGDSYGRKKVFLISLALFTGSSLACGLAPNINALIAFRFLQGIGGACFIPTASGIVSDQFPENRQAAIGLFSSIFSVGAVLGPNLGGWIVSSYSWRYIFYINVPIGIVLMAAGMLLLKDSRTSSRAHFDFGGVGLLSGSLLLLMFGLNLAGESFAVPYILLAALFVLVSLSLAVLFIWHERRTVQPILEVALLESAPFVAANLSNLVVGLTMMGAASFIPLYVTSVLKLSTLMSGVILSPRSLAMAVAAAVTAFLLRRWGYRWPMVLGFAFIAITTILLAPGPLLWGAKWIPWGTMGMLSLLLFLNGVAGGMVFPASNNACIELMPQKVGTIVGLRNMFRNVGGALGISLVTFILHVSRNYAFGFTIVFVSLGLTFVVSIPLLFLMPAGRKKWE